MIGKVGVDDPKVIRAEAMGFLSQMGRGVDPWSKDQNPDSVTLKEAFADWEHERARDLKDGSATEYHDQLTRYFSDWMDRPVGSLMTRMVEARFNQIARGEHASPKGRKVGTPDMARRVLNYLQTVLNRVEAQDKNFRSPIRVLGHKLRAPDRKDDDSIPLHEMPFTEAELLQIGDVLFRWWRQGQDEADRWFTAWLAMAGTRRTGRCIASR